VSNFQCVWRYRCLNVMHKKPYKRYEGKINDVLIAFIGYVNDLNKLQQFKVSVKKIPPSTSMHFSTLLEIVYLALLRSFLRSCSNHYQAVPNSTKLQLQVTTAVTCYSDSWVPVICFKLARASDLHSPTSDFKQLYLHVHWKLDTCLYELIYSE